MLSYRNVVGMASPHRRPRPIYVVGMISFRLIICKVLECIIYSGMHVKCLVPAIVSNLVIRC